MATDKEILQEVRDRITDPTHWTVEGPPKRVECGESYIVPKKFFAQTRWDVESSLVLSTIKQSMKRERIRELLDSCARDIDGAPCYQALYQYARPEESHALAMSLLDLALERVGRIGAESENMTR